MKTVVGLFHDKAGAKQALNALTKEGFAQEQIGVLAKEADLQHILAANQDQTWVQDAAKGGSQRAAVGGLAGLLVGISTVAIPGIGLLAAAGLAVSGAILGGLTNAFIGLAMSEQESHFYTLGLRRGGILVTVQTDEEHVAAARQVLQEAGAVAARPRDGLWPFDGDVQI